MTDQPPTPARTPPVLDALASEYQGYSGTAHRDLDIADLVNNPQADRAAFSTALAEAREREINATMARQAAQDQVVDLRKQLAESDDESNQFLRFYEAAQAKCAEMLEEENEQLKTAIHVCAERDRATQRAEAAEARLAQVEAERDAARPVSG